jgi:hypothetical protein
VTPDSVAIGYHITTRRHNPEEVDLNLHHRENLKSSGRINHLRLFSNYVIISTVIFACPWIHFSCGKAGRPAGSLAVLNCLKTSYFEAALCNVPVVICHLCARNAASKSGRHVVFSRVFLYSAVEVQMSRWFAPKSKEKYRLYEYRFIKSRQLEEFNAATGLWY